MDDGCEIVEGGDYFSPLMDVVAPAPIMHVENCISCLWELSLVAQESMWPPRHAEQDKCSTLITDQALRVAQTVVFRL